MKVKLILVQDIYTADEDIIRKIYDIIPEQDFEEVTKEEYELLLNNLYNIPKPINNNYVYWSLVALDNEKIKNRIQSVRKILDEQIKKKEEAKKKREEAKKNREQKAFERSKKQELKLLEELKKKYEKWLDNIQF